MKDQPPPRARAARMIALGLGIALAMFVVARWRTAPEQPPSGTPTVTTSGPRPTPTLRSSGRLSADSPPPSTSVVDGPPEPAFAPGATRKERAKHALASYLDWARYPPASRPARERPDRQRPHSAPARKLPLRTSSEKGAGEDDAGTTASAKTSVVLSQSHYYLAGDEAAILTLSCRRGDEPAPCTVLGASAELAPDATGTSDGRAVVAFVDDGSSPDRTPGDSVWTAMVAPARLGFANAHGPIVVTVAVDASGERGSADYQLSYTGKPPAVFTGAVREALAGGSLSLCVELQVNEAGRYVLDARVDEASGETFAFLSFNDVLAAGKQEACLVVFGKLVIDEDAKAPFVLRDVEGFLLLEDAFPDRKTVPTLEGKVHTTKAYSTADFSSQEWQSPVKDRYVGKLTKDAEEAE